MGKWGKELKRESLAKNNNSNWWNLPRIITNNLHQAGAGNTTHCLKKSLIYRNIEAITTRFKAHLSLPYFLSNAIFDSSTLQYKKNVFVQSENLNKLGTYTLHLQTVLSDGDSSTSEWAGRQLPHYTLNFSIKGNSHGYSGNFWTALLCFSIIKKWSSNKWKPEHISN